VETNSLTERQTTGAALMPTPSSALRALPSIPHAPPGRQRAPAAAPPPVRIHGSDAAISTSDAECGRETAKIRKSRPSTTACTAARDCLAGTRRRRRPHPVPGPRSISATRRPLWAPGVQPHIPRRAGHLPADRPVERGRCLIPAASRSTTSAMRSTNVRPAGRRVAPPEVRLAAELRQSTGENAPAAGLAAGALATSSAVRPCGARYRVISGYRAIPPVPLH
jgi:hypothetical protein